MIEDRPSSTPTQAGTRVPTQERARRTRAELVRAAEREFSERGYAATTTRSIAERAGVATGSFYQYFAEKDALLREIAAERLKGLHDRLMGSLESAPDLGGPSARPGRASSTGGVRMPRAQKRMRILVEAVMDYHRDDPRLHAVLSERRYADPGLDAITSMAERALVGRIAQMLERLAFPGDRAATAWVLFGMVEGTVHAHVLGGDPTIDDERVVVALTGALVRIGMLDAPKGRTRG